MVNHRSPAKEENRNLMTEVGHRNVKATRAKASARIQEDPGAPKVPATKHLRHLAGISHHRVKKLPGRASSTSKVAVPRGRSVTTGTLANAARNKKALASSVKSVLTSTEWL